MMVAWIKILLINCPAFPQQDIKSSLFQEATEAMQSAQKVHADVLAPKSYGEAIKLYREADDNFNKGKNLEDIRKRLRASVVYFNKAMQATKLAEVTFVSSSKARSDARSAEAALYAAELWIKAEAKFAEAARNLEDGDINDARKKSGEAERFYRDAELAAIKANYLQETWSLLEQANKMKVKENAPKTLDRAQELIKQAEKELNENRYDTDVARSLAQQARYEAKHAIYLNNLITQLKKDKQTWEDLILDSEVPLQRIAATMDVLAEFDTGYDETTHQIITYIQTYQDSVAKLSRIVTDQRQQIENYKEQLGGLTEEQSELKKQMEAQARVREQFQAVEKMFSREEARVIREGNDVIIRMVGLNFASGKSIIEPQYFGLLTKVQNAINTFPDCSVTIEGHTDSYGSDATNLRLSEERAEAVRQYLLANLRLDDSRISSVGYGESKPIANNETAEGRARNRRIDVVIHPRVPGMIE
jgi:outer membrane protein OmpA-like peptidoglycan-associated protein